MNAAPIAELNNSRMKPPVGPIKSRSTLFLHNGWQFQEVGKDKWYPATVPGCVHTDLLNNKLIDDPFYADNEEKLQWIGKTFWRYQTTFFLPGEFLKHENIELKFDGLDTYATVILNGTPLLKTNNMFRRWSVDCRKSLKAGENILQVHFSSPINEVLPILRQLKHPLPAVNDRGEKTSPYTRKAPYQYGWDWAPRLVTCGIWKPVTLEAWDQTKIVDFHVLQKQLSSSEARLSATVEVLASIDAEATVIVENPKAKPQVLEQRAKLKTGRNLVVMELVIPNPALWWPNGLGDQPLYTLKARLIVGDVTRDEAAAHIGLRTLDLQQKPDSWGKSFQFVVNGVPVFAKGGNWIPADSFPSRVTPAKYRHLLRSCRDANMNMLRVWGGGIYESQEFYDLCDELGLLVWQDFMFSCTLYPGGPLFLENVKLEATDIIQQLRNHPSLALWCGNNEVETGWFEWGWKKRFPAQSWNDYQKVFREILPAVCTLMDPGRPYWPSSPGSNLEEKPNSEKLGDVHYWGVWHSDLPIEDYAKQSPRFMSEYGFQSLPELSTVNTFAQSKDHDLKSAVMLTHQKDPKGNPRILNYLLRYLPPLRDFESLIYGSQVLQAEAIKFGAEHLRRMMPRSAGSLFWQITDCWPAVSWSSMDYFGRWKALHYYAKKFYQDLLVSPTEENGAIKIFIVSDRLQKTHAELQVKLMSFDGQTLFEARKNVEVAPLQSQPHLNLFKNDLLEGRNPKNLFLHCRLLVGGEAVSSNLHFFEAFKHLLLSVPRIDATINASQNGFTIRLTTDKFAKDVYLSLTRHDGHFTENYFDLLPGEEKMILFQTQEPATPKELREDLRIRSLAELFTH